MNWDASIGTIISDDSHLATTDADSTRLPLCVDMDGTLLKTDTLHEGLIALLASKRVFTALPHLLVGSRSALKKRVGELHQLDAALLPANQDFVAYLRRQKARGRMIVLATAADQAIAQLVADHYGLFDEIIASDGTRNLRGEAKAAALIERFGAGQFVYAGNDASDFAPWNAAAQIILVNTPSRVAEQARGAYKVEAEFQSRMPLARAALKAMRPHQWSKNLLVFVPLATAHAYWELGSWIASLLIFCGFCATASGIYIFNDLADLSADRRHPRKCRRPLASGDLPIAAGGTLGIFLLSVGLVLAYLSNALLIIPIYAIASMAYSFALKEYPLVDVFMLAGLYTIRVVGGGVATQHFVSIWLLAFSSFLFLSLALTKRSEEFMAVARSSKRSAARRGYTPDDVPLMLALGCGATFSSSIVLSLFVSSDEASSHYGSPEMLWALVPLLLFWQCRMWLATTRGNMHDDPIVYASKDWVSWIVGGVAFLVLVMAKFGVVSLAMVVGP